MQGTRTAAAILALAASIPGAAAADDDAAIRRDVACLVAAAGGVREDYDGPSPTLLARRLLERKDGAVKPILKEAWILASQKGSAASEHAVELGRVIRFLHGFDGAAAGAKTAPGKIGFGGTVGAVYELEGAVLARPGGTGDRGPVWDDEGFDPRAMDREPAVPTFEALIKGGKWRRPGKPDARKLLKLLDDGAVAKWSPEERRCFAMALGEVAGADPGMLPKVLQRFGDDPNDEVAGLAVAWAGAPAAVADLRSRIGPLAERVASGKQAALPLLQRACRGVARAAPEAFAEEIGKLSGNVRVAAFLGVGFRRAVPFLMAEHGKAADAAGREAAVVALAQLVHGAGFSREYPAPADMPRVVQAFRGSAEAASSAEVRKFVEDAAYGLFYMGWRDGDAHLDETSNGVAMRGAGARLGPYPDMPTILRRLDEDLAAGRIAFGEEGPRLFAPAPPATAGARGREPDDRAWSGVRSPFPNWAQAEATSPLRLRSEATEGGLRLTLRNEGKEPVAVDPVALRYSCAEYLTVTIAGSGAGDGKFTYLKVEFGPLGGWERWVVPAKELRVLATGGEFSWDLAVRPEHRDATHISIELNDPFGVDGAVAARRIRRLGWSWVR